VDFAEKSKKMHIFAVFGKQSKKQGKMLFYSILAIKVHRFVKIKKGNFPEKPFMSRSQD
jgi:hypothetical protein